MSEYYFTDQYEQQDELILDEENPYCDLCGQEVHDTDTALEYEDEQGFTRHAHTECN